MSIEILKANITDLDVDAIVNAANEGLRMGSGVCGAIFRAAGPMKLQAACNKIGSCKTGSAVITPGFDLKARHVIHAVGPIWNGGTNGEPELLYSCYYKSLELAVENGCEAVAFPLISSGIFGYPRESAWERALQACIDFERNQPDESLRIVFSILRDDMVEMGKAILAHFLGSITTEANGKESVMD